MPRSAAAPKKATAKQTASQKKKLAQERNVAKAAAATVPDTASSPGAASSSSALVATGGAPMQLAQPSPSSAAQSGPRARKRLFRRDSDDKVERVIGRKLSHLDSCMLDSRRNAKGETVRDAIRSGLKKLGSKRKYLSPEFWTDLYTDFDLHSAIFTHLPDAPDGLQVSDDLLEALVPASSENPACRSSEPLQAYLDYATAPVNKAERLLLLQACAEGPFVTRKQAHKLHLMVLKHMGKFSLHTTYPDIWDVVRESFDNMLETNYKEVQAKRTLSRISFIRANRDALQTVMDRSALAEMEKCINEKLKPNRGVLENLTQSMIGGCLF